METQLKMNRPQTVNGALHSASVATTAAAARWKRPKSTNVTSVHQQPTESRAESNTPTLLQSSPLAIDGVVYSLALALVHYWSQRLSALTAEVLSSSSQQLVENMERSLFFCLTNRSGFFQQVWWGNCWGKWFNGGKVSCLTSILVRGTCDITAIEGPHFSITERNSAHVANLFKATFANNKAPIIIMNQWFSTGLVSDPMIFSLF